MFGIADLRALVANAWREFENGGVNMQLLLEQKQRQDREYEQYVRALKQSYCGYIANRRSEMTAEKFDPKKPVQTRNGRKVRIVATDMKSGPTGDTIVALVGNDEEEFVYTYQPDGRYYRNDTDDADLVNVPVRKVMYVNVYNDGATWVYNGVDAASAAKRATETGGLVARVRIEYEEGQLDD